MYLCHRPFTYKPLHTNKSYRCMIFYSNVLMWRNLTCILSSQGYMKACRLRTHMGHFCALVQPVPVNLFALISFPHYGFSIIQAISVQNMLLHSSHVQESNRLSTMTRKLIYTRGLSQNHKNSSGTTGEHR